MEKNKEQLNNEIDLLLNKCIWKFYNDLRGAIDKSDLRDYILMLYFYMHISENYEGTEVIIPLGYRYQEVISNIEKIKSIGTSLDEAILKIEEANPILLSNFKNYVSFKKININLNNEVLLNLLDEFYRLFSFEIIKNNIEYTFEILIAKLVDADSRDFVQFYTPTSVSKLLAKLLVEDRNINMSIYDPACGTGSLLLNVHQETRNQDNIIYGQDINTSVITLARMNMILHGLNDVSLQAGDTLQNPAYIENQSLKKFDIVVSNPPFSMRWDSSMAYTDKFNRFKRGIPPKGKADYVFLSHMIESTKDNIGRMGIILPQGALFRGVEESKIRKSIVLENLLEAVIGLPPNIFYGTAITAVILIFSKSKKGNSDTLFIDASSCLENYKKRNFLREDDISKIVKEIKRFRKSKPLSSKVGTIITPNFSYRATIEDIIEKNFNLNIANYVKYVEQKSLSEIYSPNIESIYLEIKNIEIEFAMESAFMNKYIKEIMDNS